MCAAAPSRVVTFVANLLAHRPQSTGSLAGGSLLFIYGTNLQPDAPDPMVPSSVVTIGGTPCDVQRVLSSGVRLVCKTRPYSGFPLAELDGAIHGWPRWADRGCDSGKQPISVTVNGKGGNIRAAWNSASRYCMRNNADRFCAFSFSWQSTPHIVSVTPRAAAPGDLVTVAGATCAGDFINGDTGERTEPALKRFERVLIGGVACELSTPSCDAANTRQCPTMYEANLTSGPCVGNGCELPRRYRKDWWFCEDGTFQCRLPKALPLGRHNVSFKLPTEKGESVLTSAALSVHGAGANESATAFEAIPIVRGVRAHPSGDIDLLEIDVDGVDGASGANASVSVGEVDCPLVPSERAAGRLVCNRTHGLRLQLAATVWPVSCRAVLEADPTATSGFYRVQPTAAHAPIRVFCDMDTAGGGWTLCGKYDRDGVGSDGATAALDPGFGRGPLNVEAMGRLSFGAADADGSGHQAGPDVAQASIDCRPFLEGVAGHVLSVGTDALSPASYASDPTGSSGGGPSASSSASSSAAVSGPVPAGEPTQSLFDVAAPASNATLRSWSDRLEPLTGPAASPALGLTREWYGWDTYGPNESDPSVAQNGYGGTASWIGALGCTHDNTCADELWEGINTTARPPTSSDVLADPFGVFLPSTWQRYRSYAIRLSGWFVPPFTASFRFVLRGSNSERTTLYLSKDYTKANMRQVATRKDFSHWYKFSVLGGATEGTGDPPYYRTLQEGKGYYFELRHVVHVSGHDPDRGWQMLKLCALPPKAGEPNYTLPSDVGGGNYYFESPEAALAASKSQGGDRHGYTTTEGLFDLSCAPGWMTGKGENGPNPSNVSRIVDNSPGWVGSHAIMPVPTSFFRTDYTPSAEEVQAASGASNVVIQSAPGIGGWGGTCTCPDGEVYQVGDNNDGCSTLACFGSGVSGSYCGSNNPGGGNVMVVCAHRENIVQQNARGVGTWGGTCTCPDGQTYLVGDYASKGGCDAWNAGDASAAACIGGVIGPTCTSDGGPGSARVRVLCGHNTTVLPPSPPHTRGAAASGGGGDAAAGPPPPTMWGASQPSGALAFTDGATGVRDGGGVAGAKVFWGWRGYSGGAAPDFGIGCAANGSYVGTPCAPGVMPKHRYNLLMVRAGGHAQAGRTGLAQRRWAFPVWSDASALYAAAKLPEEAGFWNDEPAPGMGGNPRRYAGHDASKCVGNCTKHNAGEACVNADGGPGAPDPDCMAPKDTFGCLDGYWKAAHDWHRPCGDASCQEWDYSCTRAPHWFGPFHARPKLSEAAVHAGYPLFRNPHLMASAAPHPISSLRWADKWQGDANWLQVSSGYFVPPVTGDYLFSAWTRGNTGRGKAYVVLSSSADPSGAYFVSYSNGWHEQLMSRWLTLQQGQLYHYEFWADYLTPYGSWTAGGASAAVRLATTDRSGNAVVIPDTVEALGTLESGTATCKDSDRDQDTCFTAGTAGTGLQTNQQGWRLFHNQWSERGLDWMWKENYLFDPIPSLFLRHSGGVAAKETFRPGGRGAVRRVWGWAEGHGVNPVTGATYLDELWRFSWAQNVGTDENALLNASIAPNLTEVVSEISTGRTPLHGRFATFAETITAYFRPKRTARYAFKLWSDDQKHARLHFNPSGTKPEGAIDAAAARATRFGDRRQPWDYWNDKCAACAGRARTDFFELTAGSLYFLRIYHAASNTKHVGGSPLHLTLVIAPPLAANASADWQPPRAPAPYSKASPCAVAAEDTRPRRKQDSKQIPGEIEIDLVDDSWLVTPHENPQVAISVGSTVARCALGADGCEPPAAAAGAASSAGLGRRLQQQQQEEGEEGEGEDHHQQQEDQQEKALVQGEDAGSSKPRPSKDKDGEAAAAAETLARRGGVDGQADIEDDEDDDHLRAHAMPEELSDVEDMPARAPLSHDSAPLRQLREKWAAEDVTAAGGEDSGATGGAGGRRLGEYGAPLRWSLASTWGGAAPPNSAGDTAGTPIVYIPNGTHILLDVSVYVRIWVIEGKLTVEDGGDIEVGAEAIVINHGELHVGSAANPFAHNCTITLHGHHTTPQLPIFGIKLLGLTRGKIFMHGTPKTSFAKLASTASAGSTSLALDAPPTSWLPGDLLVVTSGTHDINCTMLRNDVCETEEVTLVAVSGSTITIAAPLRYTHPVQTLTADGRTVTLALEVINLNRNVRIRGSNGPGTSGFGGHVMLLQPTDAESAFHHVEFTRMGQAMRVGRYPLHLHAVTDQGGVGDLSNVTVVGVSVHHSFNRGLNIHGGTGATVASSTIYKNLGHAFFVEDGSETKNTFVGNLGAMTMRATSLLESDNTPSTFWITNRELELARACLRSPLSPPRLCER